MPDHHRDPDDDTDTATVRDPVEAWREQQLAAAGFSDLDAFVLAQDRTVDVHRAVRMCQAGCAPAMVAAILR